MKTDVPRYGIADNNLVISAFIQPEGVGSRALRLLGTKLTLVATDATVAELLLTLRRAKFDRWIGYERRMELFAGYLDSVMMFPSAHVVKECRDPKDDKFLELALSAKADVIVTGDDDLLCLHPWRGIAVLSPADYLLLAD